MEGNIDILVKELCKLPKETGWVEFKHNNDDPIMIGEDVSALANTATLKDAGSISRLIKEAVDKNRVKPLDPQTAKRYMRYVPIWAAV